jgi:hypothetical protein
MHAVQPVLLCGARGTMSFSLPLTLISFSSLPSVVFGIAMRVMPFSELISSMQIQKRCHAIDNLGHSSFALTQGTQMPLWWVQIVWYFTDYVHT